MLPSPRRAMLALAPLAALPARAATVEDEARALLAALHRGPAEPLCRAAHAALLFPRLGGITVGNQHAEGAALGPDGFLGRFGLAAPPHVVPDGALAVLFMTEGALRPLLHAGAWAFGDPAAGPVLALTVDADGPWPAPELRGARLFRLEPPRRTVPSA